MTGAQGWDGILDPDEEILWQGRPDPAIVLKVDSIVMTVFGLFFAGFALFWMVMAAQAGGFFWMFGLIHFAVGVGITFGAFLKKPLQNRRTWYSLSNKRAFIATDYPIRGRRLRSWPINGDTALSMDEGELSTITFATRAYRHKGRNRTRNIGFERIADGPHVYRLMRDIQRAERQEGRQ